MRVPITSKRINISLLFILTTLSISCKDEPEVEPTGSITKSGLIGEWKSYSSMTTKCYDPHRKRSVSGKIGTWYKFHESGVVEKGHFDSPYPTSKWYVNTNYTELVIENFDWRFGAYAEGINSYYQYSIEQQDGVEYLTLIWSSSNNGCTYTWKFNEEGWDSWE